MVIDGNGFTIDAKGKTRIFEVSGKNIIIKNIILKNGFSEKYGGAIYNTSELSVSGSALQGNTAEYGGAIYNFWSATLSVSDSTLLENTAEYGGAIYLGRSSKKYELNNCTFEDNNPDDVYEQKEY